MSEEDREADIKLRALRRTMALARQGQLSRAARALNRGTMHDTADPKVREALRKLHPQQRRETPPVPPDATHATLVSNPRLQRFIKKKLCRGQAPGPSGWTGEMLLPLFRDRETMELLAFFLNVLANALRAGVQVFLVIGVQ